MLEKLITNLKKSLPEPLRKKLGASEEEEVLEEEETEVESEGSDGDDSAPSSDEDKKKKQISMIIRVVIILAVGYYALDEFVLKKGSSEPSVEELLAQAPTKRKKRVVKPVEDAAKAAEGTTDATPPADQQGTTGSADPMAQTETPPIENVNITDKSDDTSVSSASSHSEMPQSNDVVLDSKPVDTSVDQKIDQLVDNVGNSSSDNLSSAGQQMEEVKIPSAGSGSSETSMASKIVDDVAVETAPPPYDQLGRGLVYNCKDKYWACVDKPAYVTCNKNMKWNKSKGNTAECVVQAIYNTDDDCAKVQKYNVNTSVATAFCQN